VFSVVSIVRSFTPVCVFSVVSIVNKISFLHNRFIILLPQQAIVGSMKFCLFGVGIFCNLANGANINLVFFNLNLINYDHSCLICEHLHL
jgi:hypothetical protein